MIVPRSCKSQLGSCLPVERATEGHKKTWTRRVIRRRPVLGLVATGCRDIPPCDEHRLVVWSKEIAEEPTPNKGAQKQKLQLPGRRPTFFSSTRSCDKVAWGAHRSSITSDWFSAASYYASSACHLSQTLHLVRTRSRWLRGLDMSYERSGRAYSRSTSSFEESSWTMIEA